MGCMGSKSDVAVAQAPKAPAKKKEPRKEIAPTEERDVHVAKKRRRGWSSIVC